MHLYANQKGFTAWVWMYRWKENGGESWEHFRRATSWSKCRYWYSVSSKDSARGPRTCKDQKEKNTLRYDLEQLKLQLTFKKAEIEKKTTVYDGLGKKKTEHWNAPTKVWKEELWEVKIAVEVWKVPEWTSRDCDKIQKQLWWRQRRICIMKGDCGKSF